MPIYPFVCKKCGAQTEITATMKEKQEMKDDKFICSECGSKDLEYILDFAGFHEGCAASDGAPPCASGHCPYAE